MVIDFRAVINTFVLSLLLIQAVRIRLRENPTSSQFVCYLSPFFVGEGCEVSFSRVNSRLRGGNARSGVVDWELVWGVDLFGPFSDSSLALEDVVGGSRVRSVPSARIGNTP